MDNDNLATATWIDEWPDQLECNSITLPRDEVRLDLGDLYVTTAAIRACRAAGDDWREYVRRHASGDFGLLGRLDEIVVTPEEITGGCPLTDEAKNNKVSVIRGHGRVHSVFRTRAVDEIWVIREYHGEAAETTLMLAEEY
jgi:hypothetical protein